MYRLVFDRAAAAQAIASLRTAFASRATKAVQTLSFPGGRIVDAEILVRSEFDLWAYISDRREPNGVYLCWFGVGEPGWQPTIEINIPSRRTLHSYGQLLADDNNKLFFAHRGGLGGGKYTVAPGPFSDLIFQFERDTVLDGKISRDYYVLGALSNPDQLVRTIARYVHEADRIRKLRRNEVSFKNALSAVGGQFSKGKSIGGDEYHGETEGGGSYLLNRKVQFDRMHARVQRSLANELKKRRIKFGDSRQKHGLGPDLYTRNMRGEMDRLFEIKVGRDSQSIFTAIGQLLVYSISEKPHLFLVARGLPRSEQFAATLDAHEIRILKYDIDARNRVLFHELDELLT